MAGVSLRGLTKKFRDVVAVDRVDLEIRDREFMVLVGPSGCGKSTCLRLIAGLEEATAGDILIGERNVNNVSPKDRDIAMVFQNYALYPHMTVYENMAFGLTLRLLGGTLWQWTHPAEARARRGEIRERVARVAGMLGLEQLLDRKPRELSGGQRQRVALGRAIVREPQVFLMDEPLSNLDARLRVQTRAELIRLHRRLGITTVYVTHDQTEAMTMGDRIAVLCDGVLQQCDTPLNLYRSPANRFVAGFIGSPSMNFLEMTVRLDGEDLWLDDDTLRLRAPQRGAGALRPYAGKRVIFGIRPCDLTDAPSAETGEGTRFRALCDVIEPMGDRTHLYLSAGSHTLVAEVDSASPAREEAEIDVSVDLEKSHAFDPETETALY